MSNNARKESIAVNRMLQKRYFLIEKARDVSIIGILVGTLAVSRCVDVIEYLKNLISKAGKKYYTIIVGKLNVPKLANFSEVLIISLAFTAHLFLD